MTKFKAAEAATEALERAFHEYSATADKLTEAERRHNECKAAYEAAVADFDGSEKSRRRTREASDELDMAKVLVGKLTREAKTTLGALIAPTTEARAAVGSALREAREEAQAEFMKAVRPFFSDERTARDVVRDTFGLTARAVAIRGCGPENISIPGAGLEVLARAILQSCRIALGALSGN